MITPQIISRLRAFQADLCLGLPRPFAEIQLRHIVAWTYDAAEGSGIRKTERLVGRRYEHREQLVQSRLHDACWAVDVYNLRPTHRI